VCAVRRRLTGSLNGRKHSNLGSFPSPIARRLNLRLKFDLTPLCGVLTPQGSGYSLHAPYLKPNTGLVLIFRVRPRLLLGAIRALEGDGQLGPGTDS